MFEIIYDSAAPYTAYIGSGAVGLLGEAAKRSVRGGRIAVVTDEGVPSQHIAKVCASLEGAGFKTQSRALPQGEANKNLAGIESLFDFFYDLGLTRTDAVAAVGGGLVGDMAGFAASAFLRGICFINVPTTLIAQTDSAYGGKTGVDLRQGKNYVGSFYDPAAVICDTDFLRTLGREQLLCGMGEIIKYGAIADADLLSLVYNAKGALPEDAVIARCAEIKRGLVEGDEHDNGKRRALNFGHTIGHAIEADSGYSVPHGQAVAFGMLAAARLGERLGVTEKGVYARLFDTVEACGLDTVWQEKASDALPLIAIDKKSDGKAVDMILLKKIGEPIRMKVEPDFVRSILR